MRNLKSGLRFSIKYNKRVSPNTSANSSKPFIVLGFFIFLLFCFAILNFKTFCYVFIFIVNLIITFNFIFKFFCIASYLKGGLFKKSKIKIEVPANLPVYTILLPCYKEEADTLQTLINAISAINYPKEKLDIKFLLEEDDAETIKNLKGLNHNFEVLLVPSSFPKTKPKACNLGLYFARGQYIVIYDVEDKPEPNQLLIALSKFAESKPEVMCVQSLLNFYNTNNLLSSCFSLEYLVWFNTMLPAFVKNKIWIPLGGTSNHFKTKELIKLGGWDAYNVTEDAELGIRIAKSGYKTELIYSYTLEKPNLAIKNFTMQRSRWLKGFLLTFLINILDFKKSIRLGFLNFIQIIFSLGFAFFGFFLMPFLIFFSLFVKSDFILNLLYSINIFCSILYFLSFFIIAKKEAFINYNKTYFAMPFYFIIHIYASFIALWDFFKNPFYWRKTKH